MLLYLLSGAAGGCDVMLGFRFRFMRVPRFAKSEPVFLAGRKKWATAGRGPACGAWRCCGLVQMVRERLQAAGNLPHRCPEYCVQVERMHYIGATNSGCYR